MKRNRMEIIQELLEACVQGATKTEMVYRVNLNFKTANCYLRPLLKEGMIEVDRGTPITYRTTQKGANILEDMKKIWAEISKLK